MEGWIKLYRTSLEHWLYNEYRPLTKREAWENILLWANYEDNFALIKGQLIECKRGQLIYSIETYAQKFVWSIGQVRSFFELLKKDNMIKLEGLKYTTRLTICNYDKYQDKQQTDNKLTTNSEQTDNKLTTTSKEKEEIKEIKEIGVEDKNPQTSPQKLSLEEKKEILRERYKNGLALEINNLYPNPTEEEKKDIKEFIAYWCEPSKSLHKMKFEMEKTWDTNLRLKKWFSNKDKFGPKSFNKNPW